MEPSSDKFGMAKGRFIEDIASIQAFFFPSWSWVDVIPVTDYILQTPNYTKKVWKDSENWISTKTELNCGIFVFSYG